MENSKWKALVSPEVSVSETAQDAGDKGLLSADEADAWIAADEWADDNFDDLRLTFPGKSVAVAYDAEQNEIATYVGDTDPAAIEIARQFANAPNYERHLGHGPTQKNRDHSRV